jgi:hypothetical protein
VEARRGLSRRGLPPLATPLGAGLAATLLGLIGLLLAEDQTVLGMLLDPAIPQQLWQPAIQSHSVLLAIVDPPKTNQSAPCATY